MSRFFFTRTFNRFDVAWLVIGTMLVFRGHWIAFLIASPIIAGFSVMGENALTKAREQGR